MSTAPIPHETFLPLRLVATRLGLPSAWLKREVAAGRVPHVRAGSRIFLNQQAVARVLLERPERADGTGCAHE